jgi:GAF domain-containing protein
MISVPLRSGERSVGVLNVVASLPHVFDDTEFGYVESLAAVISVALNIDLQSP